MAIACGALEAKALRAEDRPVHRASPGRRLRISMQEHRSVLLTLCTRNESRAANRYTADLVVV
jgi:hypothetical protein